MAPSQTGSSPLARLALSVLHFFYHIAILIKCLIPRRSPKALTADRVVSPRHVALLLHVDPGDAGKDGIVHDMVESIRRMAEWCSLIDIHTLTVYDEAGILKQHVGALEDSIPQLRQSCASNAGSTLPSTFSIYPMTPPLSDEETTASGSSTSSTTPISPVISFQMEVNGDSDSEQPATLRRRRAGRTAGPQQSLRINLICRDQGKPAIARAAQQLAFQRSQVTTDAINKILEADFPAPDLLVIHPLLYPSTERVLTPKPMELYGFPPWQIRLTEIWYNPLSPSRFLSLLFARRDTALISELDFRGALDQFATVEVKVGK